MFERSLIGIEIFTLNTIAEQIEFVVKAFTALAGRALCGKFLVFAQ